MDIDLVNKIKRIALIALASDDELVETLVLKGGNAIDLAYKPKNDTISRTSYDLDYSIEDGDFSEDEITISKINEPVNTRKKRASASLFTRRIISSGEFFYHQNRVVAAEAERVGNSGLDLERAGLIGDVIEVAVGIRVFIINGRRREVIDDREGGGDELDRSGGAQ